MKQAIEPFKDASVRRVPLWIRKGNRSIILSFIRGFFDADGWYHIDVKKNDYRVRFGQSEHLVLVDIRNMLKSVGLHCGDVLGPYRSKPNVKPYYELHLHGKTELTKFHNMIEPHHPEKQVSASSNH